MEFGQIDQQVVLCFSWNNVSASIINNNDKLFLYVEQESCLRTRSQNSLIKILANRDGMLSSILALNSPSCKQLYANFC